MSADIPQRSGTVNRSSTINRSSTVSSGLTRNTSISEDEEAIPDSDGTGVSYFLYMQVYTFFSC